MDDSFMTQVRRNLVAIISLVVAISSLSYNTWRNEVSEANRNVRHAGFQVLLTLGKLQEVVFFSHYDRDEERGNPRTGWAYVLLVGDLSDNIPDPVPGHAMSLHEVWESEWRGLGESDESAERISTSIDALRDSVLGALRDLD